MRATARLRWFFIGRRLEHLGNPQRTWWDRRVCSPLDYAALRLLTWWDRYLNLCHDEPPTQKGDGCTQ